jgi:hypothetical protein
MPSFNYVKIALLEFGYLIDDHVFFLQSYDDDKKQRRVERRQCNVLLS